MYHRIRSGRRTGWRWQSKGILDYFPWIWDIAAVLERGFEWLRFALVSTTLCCW